MRMRGQTDRHEANTRVKIVKSTVLMNTARFTFEFHVVGGMKHNTLMQLNRAEFAHRNNILLGYVTNTDTFRPTFDGH
jgi:hypothetical protein